MLLALALPLVATPGIWAAGRHPDIRELVTLSAAGLLFAVVLMLLQSLRAGEVPELVLLELLSGVPLAFKLEPVGMLFALVASGLWVVSSVYSIGYMRGNEEGHQTRFYICFAIAIGSTIGVAFAGNLLTLFIFYEALSLSTYPLVTHHGDEESKRAGRTYIGLLLGTSIGFFLLAILWTWQEVGTLDFRPGGIIAGEMPEWLAAVLLLLYMYGIGKTALMPLHRWLPAAMVAPTPVSALLHAVAVVKAGVFTVVKVGLYTFGIDQLNALPTTEVVLAIAGFTVIMASLVAIRQDNLKRRLAYSTVSQLSYVVLGVMLGTTSGMLGAELQILTHAFGKITLFFCAGAIYTAWHKTEISDMNGLARAMPVTYAAFLVGALSVIGLPPMAGSWSKFLLALGAVEAGQMIFVGVLMMSTLLNVVYLLGPVARGVFLPPPATQTVGVKEAPLPCLAALIVTAAGCIILFFNADSIHTSLLTTVMR